MQTTITAAARSHVGRRDNQEDAFLLDLERSLFIVADGMGGYEGGEVASRLVVETIASFFARNEEDADLTWPWGVDSDKGFVENLLSVAVRLANSEVVRRREGRLRQMGSTVVAATTDGERVVLGHVGDSRIYRLRAGALEQLTRDHSLLEEMRERGMVERPEGLSHVITKAIGFDDAVRPDVRAEVLAPGDTLLLCSDGVSDPLEDSEIAEILALDDLAQIPDLLISAAYDAGGSDNITALVLRRAA